MFKLSETTVPIAYSMISAAKAINETKDDSRVFSKYSFYWSAFNNIYSEIARSENHRTLLEKNPDGSVKTRLNGSVQIPKVRTVSERKQIELAFEKFDDDLKDILITHFATKFFVYRTPKWFGKPLERDKLGQKINGVLNISYTVDEDHPVWSPIDIVLYKGYLKNRIDVDKRNFLSKQVVDLLYTVRCNLAHGGKNAKVETDIEVVTHALLLLEMIVNAFTMQD
jgi:hypothetical protein